MTLHPAGLEDTPAAAEGRPITIRSRALSQNLFWHGVAAYALPHVLVIGYLLTGGFRHATLVNLGMLFGFSVLTIIGVEIGFHRYFSHRSFQPVPALRLALAVLGSAAGQGPLIYWASTHRRHHRFADQAGDPHSPHIRDGEALSPVRGFWHAHAGWMFAHGVTNTARFGGDLLQDRLVRTVSRLYPVIILGGIALPGALALLISGGDLEAGLHGAVWGGLIRLVLVQEITFSVNSVCHLFGARPNTRTGSATNNKWLGLITLGGALHNNHHAWPASAITAHRPGEVDLGGHLILGLKTIGLVDAVNTPPDIHHTGENNARN